jgi:hypothetical protein
VDSGFGNSIYWTLPVVSTIIHFTTNQNSISWFRYSVLPFLANESSLLSSWLHAKLWTPELSLLSVSQSQSHIATDGQSISESWCRNPSGAHDQIFITVWQLRSCFCGASSLTRGRVCLLYTLMALASVVFLGSESLGFRDHILLSQIWDLPLCLSVFASA